MIDRGGLPVQFYFKRKRLTMKEQARRPPRLAPLVLSIERFQEILRLQLWIHYTNA